MSDYNSENTFILATHMQAGDNKRMLLLHKCESGRLEYVIGSYFTEKRHDGALGYEHWDYSWDWGHYFSDVVSAVDYWKREVIGEEYDENKLGVDVLRSDEFSDSLHMSKETVEAMWEDFGDGACDDDGDMFEPFCGWPAGTNREDIWHWFDWQYREHGGVHALAYPSEQQ